MQIIIIFPRYLLLICINWQIDFLAKFTNMFRSSMKFMKKINDSTLAEMCVCGIFIAILHNFFQCWHVFECCNKYYLISHVLVLVLVLVFPQCLLLKLYANIQNNFLSSHVSHLFVLRFGSAWFVFNKTNIEYIYYKYLFVGFIYNEQFLCRNTSSRTYKFHYK